MKNNPPLKAARLPSETAGECFFRVLQHALNCPKPEGGWKAFDKRMAEGKKS